MNKKNAVFNVGLILFLIIAILWIYPCDVKALSIDNIMSGADDFLTKGNTTSVISESTLEETSDFIYNMLLAICMVVAVVVGLVLGIKYMTATSEEKADTAGILRILWWIQILHSPELQRNCRRTSKR